MVEVSARVQPWLGESAFQLDELRTLTERDTDLSAYPHAADVRQNVLVYSAAEMVLADRRALQAELISALADGPGVVVFAGAFPDPVVDAASAAFTDLIAAQRAAGGAAGDHFGAAGANDRVWNAAQKLALH